MRTLRAIAIGIAAFASAWISACGGAPDTAPMEAEYRTIQSPPLIAASSPPPPGEPRDFALPHAERFVLENGLEVTLVHRAGYPTTSARLVIHAGKASRPDGIAAVDLMVRTLRDGAGEWSADAISELIDSHGLAFTAVADHDAITLSTDALTTELDAAISLLGTLATAPSFPAERMEARREEALGELALAQAQPDHHLMVATRRAAFPDGHPYSRAAATADELRSVDADSMSTSWRALAGPAIAELIVVGEVPEGARAAIENAFGNWTGGPASPPDVAPVEVSGCRAAHVVVRDGSAQTSIAWIGAGTRPGAPDWIASHVANHVLGGGPSARLFLNLREDKSYTYGAYSVLSPWGPGVFRAQSSVRLEVTAPAIEEFLHEFERFDTDPLDDLGDARAYLTGVFPIELQTNAQLADRIASLRAMGVSFETLETYRADVLDVPEDAVRSAGATLMDTDTLTLVLVGDREVAVPAAQAVSSEVHVFDTDGTLVETLDGAVEADCGND